MMLAQAIIIQIAIIMGKTRSTRKVVQE